MTTLFQLTGLLHTWYIDIEISWSVLGVVSGMLSLGSDTLHTLCTIESPQWPQWAANDHGVAGAGHYMVTPSLQSYDHQILR